MYSPFKPKAGEYLIVERYNLMCFYLHAFSWQLLNMSEERMEDEFTMLPDAGTEDGDMTRLVLQHCMMPAYQLIIQVAPDQASVTHLTSLMSNMPNFVLVWQLHPAALLILAMELW